MPPTRRTVLATAGAGIAGATAGCAGPFANLQPADPDPDGLDGTAVYVAPGVGVPPIDGPTRVDDPAAADVALFQADESAGGPVGSALDAGTVAMVVGEHAQATLMQACRADGRSYGFARDSWSADTRVVAADPAAAFLRTHLFVGAEVPGDLPWAISEILSPADRACTALLESRVVPSPVADAAVPVGVSRIRGRNDVGAFDRWDRVSVAADREPVGLVLDQTATIAAGSHEVGDRRYRADEVELGVSFDDSLVASGPGAGTTDGLRIHDRSDATADHVERTYAPRTDGTRQSFTCCQRAYVTAPELPDPVTYIANARFRWRDAGLLDDELWHHHTPGQAVWYPRA